MSEQTTATSVGVVGVGSMGQNHVRVYRELPGARVEGLHDADEEHAREVASSYDVAYRDLDDLLAACEAVSIAVPTEYHYDLARDCIDAGVDVLVEKPFVGDVDNGRRLVEYAEERDAIVQVGHVERFNPAVRSLLDIVEDLDVIAVDAHRLGPPVDREIDESAAMDLMIHDVDILLAMCEADVDTVDAVATRDGRYASANVSFDSGVVGQLTASRVTQEKVRQLTVSAKSCRVTVDYIDQSIEISRQSVPEFVQENGSVTHHHESVVEQLSVENREPLKNELTSFLEAVRVRGEPTVSGRDGLRALELTRTVERIARSEEERATTVSP